nr:RNA-directed DNA polymerase, eukaryota, reverse transcriptase zinc-binding domain protein [Tanacetum cinerariifolium]
REAHLLASKGFDFLTHCKIRVGDGSNTRFWLDTWILDSLLYVRFPRLFALESVKDISVAVKWGSPSLDASFRRRARDGAESNQWSEFCSMLDSITLSSLPDRIFCDLNGEGEFRVKDIRSSIDDTFLPSSDSTTQWVKTVPIKVNILAWRTRLDRLPTQVNLIMKGVNIDSSLCLGFWKDISLSLLREYRWSLPFKGHFLIQEELGDDNVLNVQFTYDLDPNMPFDQQSWIADDF